MSGGHWGYRQYNIAEIMQDVGDDGNTIQRFPKLAQIFRDLGSILNETMHDLDWDFSGDSSIGDDEAFERDFIESLGRVISKKYHIKIYEVSEEKIMTQYHHNFRAQDSHLDPPDEPVIQDDDDLLSLCCGANVQGTLHEEPVYEGICSYCGEWATFTDGGEE